MTFTTVGRGVAYRPFADRQEVLLFAKAVKTSAIPRRDECGDYRLLGKIGQVYATGIGRKREFQLIVGTAFGCEISARQWGLIKEELHFCRLTQDGHSEGSLILDRLPATDEAATIRKCLGLRKLRELSEEERQRLRALSEKWGFRPKFPAEATMPVSRHLRFSPEEKSAQSRLLRMPVSMAVSK